LDSAYEQATDYFHGLKDHELPKYILVSDFEKFKLYDLDDKTELEFTISEFHENVKLFGFIAGYQKRSFKDQDPVNIKAAELMGKLHDKLEESGYEGHALEVFLVRLLFCLFADDTGIFEKDTFKEAIEVKTNEDGSDLGSWLAQFFQVLNTTQEKRLKNLDEHLSLFPYVNGKLFEEPLPISAFNSRMREILLECSGLDWGKISPAIFGSMFQSVMNPEERRNLGAHYTSEKNILKLIKPLFLDELQEEFDKIKSNKKKLVEFHQNLGTLKFLDPACGCGNFLIITYRELRLLELEVLKILYKDGQLITDIKEIMHVEVDQFYGIEYDEFPARIAEVAMWLMDHQMNLLVSEAFGQYYARLPLRKSATIVHGNALRTDWEQVVPKTELSYILGNPPFYGKQMQTKEQKEDMQNIFSGVKGAGVLDYVTAWYLKAANYIQNTKISVAFVSTNSISQGEQTGILWNELYNKYGIKIHFAHRTFSWKNEAKGNAAVHVVIIGFSSYDIKDKWLWYYENIKEEPHQIKVKNINPYLVEGNDIVVIKRRNPICNVSEISFGNMPNDGGNFLLSKEEKDELIRLEPNAAQVIKPLLSAHEFLNGKERYCIWLKDVSPTLIKSLKEITKRVENVRELRSKSSRFATRKLAAFPTLFAEIRQPKHQYILLPRHSTENRNYIPVGLFNPEIIVSDSCLAIDNATRFEFGVIHSNMHMTWVKYTCGRIKSDYRYSNELVYNNYPWPKEPSEKNKQNVESKAQKVLDVRAEFPTSSLADLYDPLTMPPKLVKAHQELDKAVDLCYRPQPFTSETARIEFLFDLYNEYTSGMFGKKGKGE
jgi:type I restriction-modification system DNA methylase subunit